MEHKYQHTENSLENIDICKTSVEKAVVEDGIFALILQDGFTLDNTHPFNQGKTPIKTAEAAIIAELDPEFGEDSVQIFVNTKKGLKNVVLTYPPRELVSFLSEKGRRLEITSVTPGMISMVFEGFLYVNMLKKFECTIRITRGRLSYCWDETGDPQYPDLEA